MDPSRAEEVPSAPEMLGWLRRDRNDATFATHASFFLLDTLPELVCVRLGIRNGNYSMMSAGMKGHIPLFYALNKRGYGPYSTLEVVNTNLRHAIFTLAHPHHFGRSAARDLD